MNRRPNILLVFSDQHRPMAMGCSGDMNVQTPHLDRLASDGVRFDRAYANTPVCAPFRASLYTGQYITTHGVTSLHKPLLPVQPTLPEVLQTAGYHTSHMGKWHLSGGAAPCHFASPYFRPGWDDWRAWENSNEPMATQYAEGDMPLPLRTMTKYQTDELTDWTLDWLKQRDADRPWFHVMSIEPPHGPHVAPESYMQRFVGVPLQHRPNVPRDHPDFLQWEKNLRGYYAQITNLDDNLGRVLDALDQSGEAERTLVVYLSDHGDLMGSHGRTNKSRPEEESSRIPLIARLPGTIPAGVVSEALIAAVDLMPSLLGLVNVRVPESVEGQDLSRCFQDDQEVGAEDVLLQYETTFFPYTPVSVYRGLRRGRWKYVRWLTGAQQLYDLEADPYELQDLSASTTGHEVIQGLDQRLRERLARLSDNFFDRVVTGTT